MKMHFDKIERFFLYIFFMTFPFYSAIRLFNLPLSLLIVLILLFLFFLKVILFKKFYLSETFVTSFLLVIVSLILGKYLYQSLSLRNFLPLVWIMFPVIMINIIKNEKSFNKVVELVFLSSSVLSVLVILKFFKIVNPIFINIHTHKSGLVRVLGVGKSPNANSFALFIFMVFVLSFLLFKNKRKEIKSIYFIFSFFIFIVFILCESRSLIFGFFISIGLLSLFLLKFNKKLLKKMVLVLLVIFLFFFIFSVFNPNKLIFKRIANSNFGYRFLRWEKAIDSWLINPLIGIGFENIKKEVSKKTYLEEKNAHNEYIEILVGTGIVGFFLLIFFIVNVYLLLIKFDLNSDIFIVSFIFITSFFLFLFTHSMLFTNSFWVFLSLLETKKCLEKKTK